MQHEPAASSRPAATPDPDQDQAGSFVPGRIGFVLRAVRTLLGYGRHLVDTAKQRAAAPSFASVAVCFGTSNLSTILAHLNRGILRAMALERVLLARAAAGRDIAMVEHRTCKDAAPPAPAAPADAQPADAQPAEPAEPADAQPADARPAGSPPARKAAPRPSRPAHWDDPEIFMPTLEDLEAEARRRPIGRSIVDICLDLAVVPGFCTAPVWNQLFEVMHYFGGSLTAMMRERRKREETFRREQDRRPPAVDWHWWDLSRETVRQALGFLIGEEPMAPFAASPAGAPVAAAATGPPCPS